MDAYQIGQTIFSALLLVRDVIPAVAAELEALSQKLPDVQINLDEGDLREPSSTSADTDPAKARTDVVERLFVGYQSAIVTEEIEEIADAIDHYQKNRQRLRQEKTRLGRMYVNIKDVPAPDRLHYDNAINDSNEAKAELAKLVERLIAKKGAAPV